MPNIHVKILHLGLSTFVRIKPPANLEKNIFLAPIATKDVCISYLPCPMYTSTEAYTGQVTFYEVPE